MVKKVSAGISCLILVSVVWLGTNARATSIVFERVVATKAAKGVNTFSLTVSAPGVPAGHELIVSIARQGTWYPGVIVDNRGNTYTQAVSAQFGQTGVSYVYFAPITAALQPGDTLMFQNINNVTMAATALEFSGMTAVTDNVTVAINGSGSTWSVGPLITTGGEDVVIATVGVGGPLEDNFAVSPDGWVVPGGSRVGTSGQSAASNITVNPMFKIEPAGVYSASGTDSGKGGTRLWSGAMAGLE